MTKVKPDINLSYGGNTGNLKPPFDSVFRSDARGVFLRKMESSLLLVHVAAIGSLGQVFC